MTIFGESAGGSSVCDQIASPAAAGFFQRAISTSGEYNSLLGSPTSLESQDCKSSLPTQAQADAAGAGFATSVGCGPGTADVAACLRSVSTANAETAAGVGYQDGGQGTVAPTINDSTLTMSFRQALRTGHVNRVPVIAGTDRDENLVGDPTTASAYEQLVRTQYGKYANQVLALYPVSRFDSPYVAFRTVAADSNTVCPSIVTDQELARQMPVYGYLITDNDIPPYALTGSPLIPAPAGASLVGAWYLNPVSPALDANQQVLQNQEVAEVTTFARTGNRQRPGACRSGPSFNRSGAEMELAPAGDSQVMPFVTGAIHHCGFWDSIASYADQAGDVMAGHGPGPWPAIIISVRTLRLIRQADDICTPVYHSAMAVMTISERYASLVEL